MRITILTSVVLVAVSSAAFAAPPELRLGDVRVVEGDSGDRPAEVTVTMSAAAPGPVTVSYSTRDGSATAGSDYRAATGTISFAKGEVAKRIPLAVVGDTSIEPDEVFQVVLSNASGATIAGGGGTITIVNDDRTGRNLPTYEVRLTFAGYTGSMSGADCPVRRNGNVVMTGLVSGSENVAADDDIEYTGTLQFDADIDLCEVTGPDGATRFCAISVLGGGSMRAELSVYADRRGGYIKTSKGPGTWVSAIFGSCDAGLIAEERSAFPDESKAAVFNGEELKLPPGPLKVGRYADGPMVFEVLRALR